MGKCGRLPYWEITLNYKEFNHLHDVVGGLQRVEEFKKRRPSWLWSAYESGGGCAGMATSGRLLSVRFLRWNGSAATKCFMVQQQKLKEWICQVTTTKFCFLTGEFFLRLATLSSYSTTNSLPILRTNSKFLIPRL